MASDEWELPTRMERTRLTLVMAFLATLLLSPWKASSVVQCLRGRDVVERPEVFISLILHQLRASILLRKEPPPRCPGTASRPHAIPNPCDAVGLPFPDSPVLG